MRIGSLAGHAEIRITRITFWGLAHLFPGTFPITTRGRGDPGDPGDPESDMSHGNRLPRGSCRNTDHPDHPDHLFEEKVKAQESKLLSFLEFIHVSSFDLLQTVFILVCQ